MTPRLRRDTDGPPLAKRGRYVNERTRVTTYRGYDSSKTRVGPVFDALAATGRAWLPRLLGLPRHEASGTTVADDPDLTVLGGYWSAYEKTLELPISLLSWLIGPPFTLAAMPDDGGDTTRKRRGEARGDRRHHTHDMDAQGGIIARPHLLGGPPGTCRGQFT
jgi:hypothetical protein